MPKGSHKALPLGEKVKVLSLIKTITSLAAVARIRGKNESSFVKLWRKNRNFTLVLLTRFRLQALREDGNGLTTARVGPPPGHLSDEGSTRRQGTPSLCDDRPGPGNEATPANAGEKRRRGGRPGLRLLEHPGAGERRAQARFHRSCLCLSVRGCRSSRAVPGPRRRPDHRAVGGRVCSAAVSAGARAFRVLSAADAGGLLEAAVTPLAAPTPHCSASGRRFRTLVGN